MRRVCGSLACAIALFLAVAQPSMAGPKVSVSSKEYNADTVMQGKLEYVRHTFKLKNTGDEPLRIKRVRPG